MEILIFPSRFTRVWYFVDLDRENEMPDEPPPPTRDTELTTNIVAAYVRRNQIEADQLLVLISAVHQGARRSRKIESQGSPNHAARNTT